MNDSSGREIITLQVGRYANFVGAHFWNFQDELLLLGSTGGVVDDYYSHGVLHRPAGERGGVCTPRLLAFDTRDALGSLNPLGIVGGTAGATVTADAAQSSWAGGVSVFRQPIPEKNALHTYLDAEDEDGTGGGGGGGGGGGQGRGGDEEEEDDEEMEVEEARVTGTAARLTSHPFGLDDTVTTWPDFLKAQLHPRTLQELPFRDESSDFGIYTAGGRGGGGGGGAGALGEVDREAHSDALRRQLEECDAAQGTQTLVDLDGGWGGLGSALALELQEECRNRPRVCHAFLRRGDAPAGPGCGMPGAVGAGTGGAGAAREAVNLALGLHGLGEAFSLLVISDEEACGQVSPHMSVDPANAYHTSAVLGAALDVTTSPLRFSSTRLDAWASAGAGAGGGGGGVPLVGGGGAFGGGGRAPAPGADMTLASLSAWLPLPHPDASVETLKRLLLLLPSTSSPSSALSSLGRGGGGGGGGGGDARMSSPLSAPPSTAAPLAGNPGLAYTGGTASNGMVSLGPVGRRRRGLLGQGPRRGLSVPAAATADLRVFSRKMVARGFSAPRAEQLEVLAQVLNGSGAGSGSSFAVSTPLPIPITYPLLFRESLGSRGEQLFAPRPPPPPPPPSASSHVTASSGGGVGGAGVADGRRGGGELRVMCDEISAMACVERTSTMGRFLGQAGKGLDLRRGRILLELEKNDLHKDDALEVLETLTGLAESYGYFEQEAGDGDGGRGGGASFDDA